MLLEILAVITGIISVWLTKKENIFLYPVGIISVLLWIYLCWLDITILLEILAVITGIISVWLTKKENVLLYPIGIISVLLWIYLCWVEKLFGRIW